VARCPDCNKFVPYEQGDVELDVNAELVMEEEKPVGAVVSGNVRLILTCGECGTEMAEANPDFDVDVPLEHTDAKDHEVEVVDEDASNTDRYDGKPNTPSRYRRHYWGAEVSGKVKCSCGAEAEFRITA
jgi:hypothetical protein